jgi:ElaB/YqjD/DUF883 family membrane-anchored ribosome-binding protein
MKHEERIMDAMNREATELEEDLGQGGNLKSKFNRGAEKAKEFASKASEKATEYAGVAKEKATEYAGKAKDATETKIREYPLWSMAVAMGIGMCVGLTLFAMVRKNEVEY